MMRFTKFSAFVATIFLALTNIQVANAVPLTLDFDSVTTQFWIAGTSQDGFDVDNTNDGFGTLAAGYEEGYWRGNGTGRLLSWTNVGTTSGFTLQNQNNELFDLLSFDFGNGYVAGNNAVSEVVLTGTYANGTTVTTSFLNTVNDWNSVNLTNDWIGLSSVNFTAYGGNNRTVWDNIALNTRVPEPGTILLFALGLLGLVAGRKKVA